MDSLFQADLARYGPHAPHPDFTLRQARKYCQNLAERHYENFPVASFLLPRRLVPHFHAVYGYCRWADDLGDETAGGPEALELLDWWRGELDDCYRGEARHPVMVALRETIRRFDIPREPFLDLITAFERDQTASRYGTFEELLGYCRFSANPVGRLVLHLCDSFTEENARFSDFICTGLQLANFWQDIARDFDDVGRIYLPQEDLRRFGVVEGDIAAHRFTPAFRDLMQFQVERAKSHLEAGRPLMPRLPLRIRMDIELFRQGGLAILRKIERNGYDVLRERPRLSRREKLTMLVGTLACGMGISR